jgi:hypothetical protein
VENLFASFLVDVAYIDETTPGAIFVVGGGTVSLADRAGYEWLASVIGQTLTDCGILRVQMAVDDPDLSGGDSARPAGV